MPVKHDNMPVLCVVLQAAALHQRLVDEAEDVLQRLEATSGSMLSRAKVGDGAAWA